MYFFDFAGYFAENVGNYTDNVVAVDFEHFSFFNKPMVVIDIRANSLFDCLQLSQYLLRPEFGDEFGHLIDGVEEIALNLKLWIDIKKRRSKIGVVRLDFF